MAIPNGINKRVIVGKETTFGVAATDTVGKVKRRVSADINLVKNTFESNEIRTDYQVADMRHGSRRVEGTLNGELSCASYEDEFAAVLRGPWVAGVTSGALTSIAAASPANTLTRSAGSFVSSGFKIGDVVNVAGFTAPATANNGRYVIGALTPTVMTLIGAPLVTKAAGDSVTINVPGKKLIIPSTGHTRDSFTIEQLYDMIGSVVSEMAVGCRISTCAINVQPNGMTTVNFGVMGKDMDSDASAYFQSPAAQAVTGVTAGPNGVLIRNGVAVATVTGFNVDINGNMSVGEVIGSKVTPDVFVGRIQVSGQFSAYFADNTLWTAFKDEEELSLAIRLDAGTNQTFAIILPRIKLGGAGKDDPATGGTVQTVPFTALKYVGSGNYDATTIALIDSELV